MSVAWFTRLYRLNEAGRFDEAAAAAKRYLAKRPADYALHLQCAKSLISLGQLDDARVHVEASIRCSKSLAAWPWFYAAALAARLGESAVMYEAMDTALRLDAKLKPEFAESPFFAAFVKRAKFVKLVTPSSRQPRAGRASLPSRPASRPAPRRRRATT